MNVPSSPDPLETTWPRVIVARAEVPSDRPVLTARVFGVTDKGKERRSNEDRFLIASPASALWIARPGLHASELGYPELEGHVFAVADGIGGHAGGAEASELALETVSASMLSTLKWVSALGGPDAPGADMVEQLAAVLCWADARVREEAARSVELREMGCTLTLAYAAGDSLFVAHAGDSRCYLLRGGALQQITQDHTVVSELVQCGVLSAEEARRHGARHVITNALGGITAGLKPEGHRLRLQAGDVVLLCTDGLTEMLDDAEIASVLGTHENPNTACERLVHLANDHGGRDNVTAVVARFEDAAAAAAERLSS